MKAFIHGPFLISCPLCESPGGLIRAMLSMLVFLQLLHCNKIVSFSLKHPQTLTNDKCTSLYIYVVQKHSTWGQSLFSLALQSSTDG